jgi:hypothetical protein
VGSCIPTDAQGYKEHKVLIFIHHKPASKMSDINFSGIKHLCVDQDHGIIKLHMPEPKLTKLKLNKCCWRRVCEMDPTGSFCGAHLRAQIKFGLRSAKSNATTARDAAASAKRTASTHLRKEAVKRAKTIQVPCGRLAKGKCAKMGPESPGRVVCGFPHCSPPGEIECISTRMPVGEWPGGKNPCEFNGWPGMKCPYLNHTSSNTAADTSAAPLPYTAAASAADPSVAAPSETPMTE